MCSWLSHNTLNSTPRCSLAPSPIVVQASPLMVAVALDPQWSHSGQSPGDRASTAQGHSMHQLWTLAQDASGSPGLQHWWHRPLQWCPHQQQQVPGCQVLCAPTQNYSQGARKTVLVAGDSTGPGAIHRTVGVSIPAGASARWIFTTEGLVGSEQGHGVGQDPCDRVPVGLCRCQLCCWQRGQPGEDHRDCVGCPACWIGAARKAPINI